MGWNRVERYGVEREREEQYGVERYGVEQYRVERYGEERYGVEWHGKEQYVVDGYMEEQYMMEWYRVERYRMKRYRWSGTGGAVQGGAVQGYLPPYLMHIPLIYSKLTSKPPPHTPSHTHHTQSHAASTGCRSHPVTPIANHPPPQIRSLFLYHSPAVSGWVTLPAINAAPACPFWGHTRIWVPPHPPSPGLAPPSCRRW